MLNPKAIRINLTDNDKANLYTWALDKAPDELRQNLLETSKITADVINNAVKVDVETRFSKEELLMFLIVNFVLYDNMLSSSTYTSIEELFEKFDYDGEDVADIDFANIGVALNVQSNWLIRRTAKDLQPQQNK